MQSFRVKRLMINVLYGLCILLPISSFFIRKEHFKILILLFGSVFIFSIIIFSISYAIDKLTKGRNHNEYIQTRLNSLKINAQRGGILMVKGMPLVPSLLFLFFINILAFTNAIYRNDLAGYLIGFFFLTISLLGFWAAAPRVGKADLILSLGGFSTPVHGNIPWSEVQGINLKKSIDPHLGTINSLAFYIPNIDQYIEQFSVHYRFTRKLHSRKTRKIIAVSLIAPDEDPEILFLYGLYLWWLNTGRDHSWNSEFSDDTNEYLRQQNELDKRYSGAVNFVDAYPQEWARIKNIVEKDLSRKNRFKKLSAAIIIILVIFVGILNILRHHPDEATRLDNRAEMYIRQGQYSMAEPLFIRSLEIREHAYFPNYVKISHSLNNLGDIYRQQEQYAKAAPLYKRSLDIGEKYLGPDNPAVAQSLNNLALIYGNQGHYVQALLYNKRSLAIREKTLGPDSPLVAQSLNNLALIYGKQGHYMEALRLSNRSLAIWEKTYGPKHPIVALGLDSLASLYKSNGQYAKAESLYIRSLEIKEKSLGPGHHEVASTLFGLSDLYWIEGHYDKALPLIKRLLVIDEQTLGPDNPEVATTLHNLGRLYQLQGQYDKAEPLYKSSLAIDEKVLDPDNPNIALTLEHMAQLYKKTGQLKLADELENRALAIREKNIKHK